MWQVQMRPFQYMLLWLCIGVVYASAHGGGGKEEGEPGSGGKGGLIVVKVWCMVIVFFATFLGGISPVFFKWNHGFLVLGTQFAGGVFMSTAVIHFLHDSDATFRELTKKEYPFAFMLAVAGYFLTMLGDAAIQWIYAKNKPKTNPPAPKATPDVETCNDMPNQCACDNELSQAPEAKSVVTLIHKNTIGDTILLILALCFHSFFEGIAIGVANTKSDAWKALWIISLHKVFAAIAMGIALLRLLPNRPLISCTWYSFAFAISSPIGVAVGIIIDSNSEGDSADWTYAISMGLASGIFVYVSINHLLVKGFVPPCKVKVDQPFYKVLAAILGGAMIAIVMIWD